MPWLSPADLQRSHFEIGSGTCLQPLLRFSDRCAEYLFVDLEGDSHASAEGVRQAVKQLGWGAEARGTVAPLVLDGIEVAASLTHDDIELAASPSAVLSLAAETLGSHQSTVDRLVREVDPRQPQWGLRCALTRQIEHVDGTVERRPLTLRIMGGEGIPTLVGLGGLEAPPLSVGTVQTGLGEQHDGPLAELFRFQASRSRPLPSMWVRGRVIPAHHPLDPHWPRLQPAPPYSRVGQVFTGWVSDRHFDLVHDRRRTVAAWIEGDPSTPPPLAPPALTIGPHRILATRLDRAAVDGADVICLPAHLAATLGVSSLPHVNIVERPSGNVLSPIAHGLRRWAQTDRFRSASRAVLVMQGYEDELGTVTRFLSSLEGPAVQVLLPMPLDFAAAVRAASTSTNVAARS